MSTSDNSVAWKQCSELTLAQQPGELTAMPGAPRCLPMPEENSGVRFDREPPIGCGHSPVFANSQVFGNEGPLVGFVADMLDDGVRDDQVEGVFGEGQVPAVGDHEVVPRHRVFFAPVEALEQDAAWHKHVDGLGQSVGDDVLEGLILSGLNANDQHAASTDGPSDLFESVSLSVSVVDAESAGRGLHEGAHGSSLSQANAAKPIVAALAALVALLCLLAAGCSQISTEDASLTAAPAAEAQVGVDTAPVESATQTVPDAPGANESSAPDSQGASTDSSASDAPESDRGSRIGAGEDVVAEATPEDTPSPQATATAVASTAEAGAAESADAADPDVDTNAAESDADATAVPTPVATTAPVVPPVLPATVVPTPVPTPTQVATQDPEAGFVAPAPTEPLPSDGIVVQGPQVDESEALDISVNGAAACARAESAIGPLDLGDTQRTADALLEASQFASQAAEPEIAAMASQLAAASTSEDAAITAIIAMLNACALHGYQV